MDQRELVAALAILLVLFSGCGDDGRDGPGNGQDATDTPTASHTRTPSVSYTSTAPLTSTATGTVASTWTPSSTPTATPTPLPPKITYLGIARADDVPQGTTLFDDQGRPVFVRLQGQGMNLIVEAQRGLGGQAVGVQAFDPEGRAPDLQMLVSRPLGNGSTEVCDFDIFDPSLAGGVPATEPLEFSDDPGVVAAMNDLGCRVDDGTGLPRARQTSFAACTQTNGEFAFVDPASEVQFCLPIARAWAFPTGDTIVAARVRDRGGQLSAPEEIVIRISQGDGFTCEGMGQRFFTLARPASMFLSSAQPGEDLSIGPWQHDPIRICAGPELEGGLHQLTLLADAIFGFRVADGSTICAKLLARASEGTLDCDGGTAHDVRATQEVGSPLVLETGLGLDAGTGAATLTAAISLASLPLKSTS